MSGTSSMLGAKEHEKEEDFKKNWKFIVQLYSFNKNKGIFLFFKKLYSRVVENLQSVKCNQGFELWRGRKAVGTEISSPAPSYAIVKENIRTHSRKGRPHGARKYPNQSPIPKAEALVLI